MHIPIVKHLAQDDLLEEYMTIDYQNKMKQNQPFFKSILRIWLFGMGMASIPIFADLVYKNKNKFFAGLIIFIIINTIQKIKNYFCFDQVEVFNQQKNKIFPEIWNLFHTTQKNFQKEFDVFQKNFKLYYNLLNEEEKCFINTPHCPRCRCTPLFATILAAESALETGMFKKREVINRLEIIALYLACGDFHLDYRVALDLYFKDDKYHITTPCRGWRDVFCNEEKKFLDACEILFGEKKKEGFIEFKSKIESSIQSICVEKNHRC